MMNLNGRVIEEQKNYFLVDTINGVFRCQIKGTLKKDKVKVCTGDLVDIEIINSDTLEGLIIKIHKRISFLKRPSLSNLTQIVFINTYKQPELDLESLDRFLFTAEVYHIPAVIVFNKLDIIDNDNLSDLQKIISYYNSIGYHTLLTSARTELGLQELKKICDNQISAFTGLSGVGKSTLLSCLFPNRVFRTAQVSGSEGRGTHTTTSVVLLPYNSGYIADTPGFSFVNIPHVDENDAIAYFPELAKIVGQCRFNNCLHNGEPGCAVQVMIDNGVIAESRRFHFLRIYRELKEQRRKYIR